MKALFLQKKRANRGVLTKRTNMKKMEVRFFPFLCININFFLQNAVSSAMIIFSFNSLFII